MSTRIHIVCYILKVKYLDVVSQPSSWINIIRSDEAHFCIVQSGVQRIKRLKILSVPARSRDKRGRTESLEDVAPERKILCIAANWIKKNARFKEQWSFTGCFSCSL